MVNHSAAAHGVWLVAQRGFERLDPHSRATVLAALAGLLILGSGMILLAWLAGRAARRYMQHSTKRRTFTRGSSALQDDWAAKPLVPDHERRVRGLQDSDDL